jgi:hypothetical protein
MQAEVKGIATMVILLLRLQKDIATQSQSMFTTMQLELNRKRFELEPPALNTLVESSIQRIGWQYADYLRENANDSKAFQTITP